MIGSADKWPDMEMIDNDYTFLLAMLTAEAAILKKGNAFKWTAV